MVNPIDGAYVGYQSTLETWWSNPMEEPVIVIHGTFDNDATWWRPDGSFCERLDNRLRQQGSCARCWDSMAAADAIREFRWNGLNSEASRTHAAELLATKIAALIEKQSVERVHFVAHSHGGNVLLKALFLSRVNVYDDKLGSVIFLGTPFFSYKSMTSNWRFIGKFSKIRDGEYYRKNFFVIASKYDEAYRLLRHAVQFRDSARFYSRKWSENSRSGEPLARSLRPSTMLGLLYGRYRLVKIGPNFEFALKLGQRINQIGYIGRLRLALNMLAVHGIQSLVSVIAPVVSITKRWGQRWGTYFGIRAMASTALGDDLGFERILSVNQNSDMIPTVMVKLNDE